MATDEEIADEINTLFRMFEIKFGHAFIMPPAYSGFGRYRSRANMKYRIGWGRPVYQERAYGERGTWINAVYKEYSGWDYHEYKFRCNSIKKWRDKAHEIINLCKDDPKVGYFK